MKITLAELQWVKNRMEIYDIKFQETYDEILDHIITAIEERRNTGDTREIAAVFQNVVDDEFNGYIGIEALAITAEQIYRKNIRDIFYNRLKHLFNLPAMVIAIILLAVSYYLPNVKYVHVVLMVSIFLLAVSPIVYTGVAIAGKTRTIKGKKSLLKSFLMTQVGLPLMLLNGAIYAPQLFTDDNFKLWMHITPVALMAVLLLFLVINVSYIQSTKDLIDKSILKHPTI